MHVQLQRARFLLSKPGGDDQSSQPGASWPICKFLQLSGAGEGAGWLDVLLGKLLWALGARWLISGSPGISSAMAYARVFPDPGLSYGRPFACLLYVDDVGGVHKPPEPAQHPAL